MSRVTVQSNNDILKPCISCLASKHSHSGNAVISVDEAVRHVHRSTVQSTHDLSQSVGSDKSFDVVELMNDDEVYRNSQDRNSQPVLDR